MLHQNRKETRIKSQKQNLLENNWSWTKTKKKVRPPYLIVKNKINAFGHQEQWWILMWLDFHIVNQQHYITKPLGGA